MKQTTKRYSCSRCGHIEKQKTNHFGNTWSFGRYNTCPKCPPFAKYPEFGGQTVWNCLESPEYPIADNPEQKAKLTGEFRKPVKGEYFLSGAIPEVYQAQNNMSVEYMIAELV